jgi:hypothetical protein
MGEGGVEQGREGGEDGGEGGGEDGGEDFVTDGDEGKGEDDREESGDCGGKSGTAEVSIQASTMSITWFKFKEGGHQRGIF